ncbi:MAG: xylosidase [Tannerellaceae bacterium]|nr:xylosidase [Tannerellaceae bacterium]
MPKEGSTMEGQEPVEEAKYDETGCNYTNYKGLVMAGYQGWFSAEGDKSNNGWTHYGQNQKFEPGSTCVDFWPDVSEYDKTYETAFNLPNGEKAHVFSPQDESTVDLHFKWMKEYGLHGVFVQRFLVTVKNQRQNTSKVFENALKAANKHDRAICVMYDLSGSKGSEFNLLINDFEQLIRDYELFNNKSNPTYLRHNGKPLIAIWGVGFNDHREYTIQDVANLVKELRGNNNKVSIMLGVPYFWRTLDRDAENNRQLHELIKTVDIIMPWAVGRYSLDNYDNFVPQTLLKDLEWCKENEVDYIPLAFPGFSWGNLLKDASLYDEIPRHKGEFLWQQIAGAYDAGAQSLYLAMFDEIDEGTALFKCLRQNEVPENAPGFKFVGIEDNLPNDHYLWLSGEAAKWFAGDKNHSTNMPVRE